MKLMDIPRCVVAGNDFRLVSKWTKTNFTWYFSQANEEYRNLAKKAFEIWQENSNVRFSYVPKAVPVKPDITITVQKRQHWFRANCQGSYKCSLSFDGPGVILAHAYNPSAMMFPWYQQNITSLSSDDINSYVKGLQK